MALATGACGELTPEELAAMDSPAAPVATPSLADPAPVVDQREPARPELLDPQVDGEHAAPVAAPGGEVATSVRAPGPRVPGSLELRPWRGDGSERAPRDLIPGNAPASGGAGLAPLRQPTPVPACDTQCPAGTVVDAETCDCMIPVR